MLLEWNGEAHRIYLDERWYKLVNAPTNLLEQAKKQWFAEGQAVRTGTAKCEGLFFVIQELKRREELEEETIIGDSWVIVDTPLFASNWTTNIDSIRDLFREQQPQIRGDDGPDFAAEHNQS